jgi:hypothetical protein
VRSSVLHSGDALTVSCSGVPRATPGAPAAVSIRPAAAVSVDTQLDSIPRR